MSALPRQLYEVYPDDATCLMPLAVAIDGTLFAHGLSSHDPKTGGLPDGLEAQVDVCLARLSELAQSTGTLLDNVARATCYVTSPDDREPFYERWEALFAPDDKPALKVLIANLPAGQRVRLDVMLVPGQTRRRIELPGVIARDPTVAIGDWVFTSRLHAVSPQTGQQVSGVRPQAQQCVENARALVAAAGLQVDDIVQLTTFGNDLAYAVEAADILSEGRGDATLNTLISWVRPGTELMLEAAAHRPGSDGTRREFRDLYLDSERSNIAAGFRLGALLFAAGLGPADAGSTSMPEGVEQQIRSTLENMDRFLAAGGASRAEVARVSFFMRDLNERETLNRVWSEWYPDPDDRPPHTYLPAVLPDGQDVAIQVIAVAGAKRRVLKVAGIEHGDPMSLAAVTGNLLFSSRIFANVRGEGDEILGRHTASCFETADALLTSAGADWPAVTQLTSYVSSDTYRGSVTEGLAQRPESAISAPTFLQTDLGRRTLLPRLQLTAVLPAALLEE